MNARDPQLPLQADEATALQHAQDEEHPPRAEPVDQRTRRTRSGKTGHPDPGAGEADPRRVEVPHVGQVDEQVRQNQAEAGRAEKHAQQERWRRLGLRQRLPKHVSACHR